MQNLVIGGTGTLGQQMLKSLGEDRNNTIVLSRDELKQQEIKKLFPEIRCVIGDIRDRETVNEVISRLDDESNVYHFAALKHIDVVEENAAEAVKTNVMGLINVAEACDRHRIKKLIFTSTDKAVDPINIYGMTKGIAERYLLDLQKKSKTKIFVYRWGNIVGSRGSVIPYFAKTLKESKLAYVTDIRMTRFWLTIEQAVGFMLGNDIPHNYVAYPDHMKSACVLDIIKCIAEYYSIIKYDLVDIGIRTGEKIHEAIGYNEKGELITSENAPRYTVKELRHLIWPFLKEI